MSLITIEQLLESVNLDFEPRWITKDECGAVAFWEKKPTADKKSHSWYCFASENQVYPSLKLAEFKGKDWQECIYEVPRKTTGKIEKVEGYTTDKILAKVNEIIDWINDNHKDSK